MLKCYKVTVAQLKKCIINAVERNIETFLIDIWHIQIFGECQHTFS